MEAKEDRKISQDLNEQSWDLFGQILLSDDVERYEVLLQSERIKKAAEEYYQKYNERNKKKIQKIYWRKKRNVFFKNTLPSMLKMIVMIAGALSVVIGTAIAASPLLRKELVKLMTKITSEYTTMQIIPEEQFAFVPREWKGLYFPAVLPDDIELMEIYSDPFDNYVSYSRQEGGKIIFSFEEIYQGTMNLDTEEAKIETVFIHEKDGKAVIKGDHITIYWMEEECMLKLYLRDGTLEETLAYAEAVRKIAK